MSDIAPQETPRSLFSDSPGTDEAPPARSLFTDQPLAEAPFAPGPRDVYSTLSLLAVAGAALALFVSVAVLLGGLAPFAKRYPALLYASLALLPLLAVAGAAGRGQRDPTRLGQAFGIGLAGTVGLFGIGGLLAFSGSNPWMLPSWFWGVAILAVLVCVLARFQVLASEGALTGEPMARAGLLASLFFGLIYLAYQSSISLAVAGQARAVARDFLAAAQRGD
ncbi:MAG: hypothetical protein K2W96_20045, partial [Gemmataceae bacterium]|nr:hypothetical protein [Gemmataceae bacterium]